VKPICNAIGKTNCGTRACILVVLYAAAAISLPAQIFTTLHSFDGADGVTPIAGLVQGLDGNLYGTTVSDGANQRGGTIFKITPGGTLTTLYSFCVQEGCPDGKFPYSGLVQATNGNLYGTTYRGGANDLGTVFAITPAGARTTLYSFCSQSGCTDGAYPEGTLVQYGGAFYGTTSGGGANGPSGTVFKITPSGALTTLYSFCSQANCADGEEPGAGLIQATNGNFYGTTETGGANCTAPGCGTIFQITPAGTLTTLYSFCSLPGCSDGGIPVAGLVQGTEGAGYLYGTTQAGGDHAVGTVFKIGVGGGSLSTLYSFCSQTGCADGSYPNGGLVQDTDGVLYGTTTYGGACPSSSGCGTIFKIRPTGGLTTLYNFCSQGECPDGEIPDAVLVQDTNGSFYGTTNYGGADLGGCSSGNGCGTVFSLSVGLGPFVKTLPASGPVGTAVEILGSNLTGTTSVNFNGTAAPFTVVSNSEITTTVPAGATYGLVQVVTPTAILSSNRPFPVGP